MESENIVSFLPVGSKEPLIIRSTSAPVKSWLEVGPGGSAWGSSNNNICRIDSEGNLRIPHPEKIELTIPAAELACWREGRMGDAPLSMSDVGQVLSCFAKVLEVLAFPKS